MKYFLIGLALLISPSVFAESYAQIHRAKMYAQMLRDKGHEPSEFVVTKRNGRTYLVSASVTCLFLPSWRPCETPAFGATMCEEGQDLDCGQ